MIAEEHTHTEEELQAAIGRLVSDGANAVRDHSYPLAAGGLVTGGAVWAALEDTAGCIVPTGGTHE
jgi:acyl-coenzyme A thioesterase PaaI-like protein